MDEKESSESERRYDEEEKVVLETVGDTSVSRGGRRRRDCSSENG